MKLWEKGYDVDKKVMDFTIGNDKEIDLKLVKYDCFASITHAKMLYKIKVITHAELNKLVKGLNEILSLKFEIQHEDCHSAIEDYLTTNYGNVGKKIHTGRSRNDQVLTALRLFEKHELKEIGKLIEFLKQSIAKKVKKYKKVAMPGYTHMQKAMPTTVGIWLGSFVDALEDDLLVLKNCLGLIDKNPLGSGAGFGVPLEVDKKMTAKELGFVKVMENPMYVQFSRGKFEAVVVNALSNIMLTLNKLATDLMLFSMKEFSYVTLPKEFCTGSSIMPQKKNPDVLELVKAYYHVVVGEEMKIKGIIGNLMSGYNRDLQLTKEPIMKSVDVVKKCLEIMALVCNGMVINKSKLQKAMTQELFVTEKVYTLVKKGVPFREAYKKVAKTSKLP